MRRSTVLSLPLLLVFLVFADILTFLQTKKKKFLYPYRPKAFYNEVPSLVE
jgi:hypothetical protein